MTTQRLLLVEPPDSSIPIAPEMRETFRVLDVVATGWIVVLSATTTAPPASPLQGDSYIVPGSATGAWSGHQNHLAIYTANGWIFRAPRYGWIAVVADQNTPYGRVLEYNATDWVTWLLPASQVSFTTAGTDFVSTNLQALMLEINPRILQLEADDADHENRITAIEAEIGGGGTLNPIDTEILADSPTAYWKLDEASGNFADSSGNGFTLTPSGTIRYQQSALVLRTSDKYAHFESGAGASRAGALGLTMPLTGDWTIEGIMLASIDTQVALFSIAGLGDASANTNAQAGLYTPSGNIAAFWESGTGSNQEVQFLAIPRARPIHVVMIKDGTANTLDLWINGCFIAQKPYTTEPTGGVAANVSTGIGQTDGFNSGNLGLAHVAFYNGSKLSGARILQHAKSAGFH